MRFFFWLCKVHACLAFCYGFVHYSRSEKLEHQYSHAPNIPTSMFQLSGVRCIWRDSKTELSDGGIGSSRDLGSEGFRDVWLMGSRVWELRI